MKQKIFVDTSAWIAIADSSDAYHDAALSYKDSIGKQCLLITTDYILGFIKQPRN